MDPTALRSHQTWPVRCTSVHPPGSASRRLQRPVVVEAITRLNIGGPGRHVLDVARGLSGTFDVRVAAGTAPQVEGELDAGDVAIDRLPLVRSVDPRLDTAALAGMRRLLQHHQPALVHSHMAKAGTVARLAAASLRERPRTIHTFHGHVLSGYFSPRSEALFASIERRLARRTDVLVAVSAEVRDALLDLRIGRPEQYEVLPLGVELCPFLRVERPSGRLRTALGLPDDVPLVGVPARLVPVKDHDTLLAAVAEVPGAHLVLLGDGELRRALELRAGELRIDDRVHFTGWWLDMAEALSDVDVVALTSRNEGTPMALIEAAAAAKPVVATDVGGVSDVVIDGRTGLLVQAGDHAGVAASLRWLLGCDERRQRLGGAARAHVRSRYGLEASLSQLGALYEDLLGRRS